MRVNLADDCALEQWQILLDVFKGDLGIGVPLWLAARDSICSLVERDESVNLVVKRRGIKWRSLLVLLCYDSTRFFCWRRAWLIAAVWRCRCLLTRS